MNNKFFLSVIAIVFVIGLVFSPNIFCAADDIKPVQKTVIIPAKVKVPIIKTPHIYMISQDLTPGYTLEVTGKNMGVQTFTSKFIVGGYIAEILGWQNDFILLKFPDSPTLGKKIKSYIMKGSKIVSNQKEHTLQANAGNMIPKSVFTNYGFHKSVALEAAWCGTDKKGMSLRFKKLKSLAPLKPVYAKVISITTGSGDYDNINAILPTGLAAGTYLVDLIQDGRVASGPPVSFQVKKLMVMKEKLDIK